MADQRELNVLIVDDEVKITELLTYSLRNYTYVINVANSGAEALAVLSEIPIDIIVTDIRMPEMDGFELSRKALAQYPNLQIIIMSAHGDVDSAVEALKMGAVDFLQKPVDPEVLKLSLNSAAEKWRLRHELQLAYDHIEKEKELLTVTLRSMGDGLVATDLDGKVTLINYVAAELTGWSMDEASGKPLSEVFHIINEKTREICDNPVSKVLMTGRIIGLANHTALIAKNGTEKSIADSAAPIRDRRGKVVGAVLVFRDVTLENRLGEELAKTKKLESVGILAGGIAHDFNNILTGIMANINVSMSVMDPNEEAYAFLKAAELASKRANRLTQQLLTFSRGGAPILELSHIYDVVRESADFTLTGSGVACRIDQDLDLWAVELDKGQISQVVQNIVLNARQAMPEGGTISILCENYAKLKNDSDAIPIEGGDYIRIQITDEGVGIHPNQIDKIFDPYFSTKQEGSGLGLAVTHSIINKHRGHIGCESDLGRGTTFTIYLPAVREPVAQEKEKIITQCSGDSLIMIMDDDEMIRTVTQGMLEISGYNVIQATDGEEALKVYKECMDDSNPIGLVIMDLTIQGGMGGAEAIKILLEMDPQAVAIVSSGYSNDPVMANYHEYGFKGCLVKPYVLTDLTEVISKLVLQ